MKFYILNVGVTIFFHSNFHVLLIMISPASSNIGYFVGGRGEKWLPNIQNM